MRSTSSLSRSFHKKPFVSSMVLFCFAVYGLMSKWAITETWGGSLSIVYPRNLLEDGSFRNLAACQSPLTKFEAAVVPPRCLRSNAKWANCVFRMRHEGPMSLCGAYRACDHVLNNLDTFSDESCRFWLRSLEETGQSFSSSSFRHEACCLEVWWPINSTAEKPYMNEQFIGKYLHEICALTIRSLHPNMAVPHPDDQIVNRGQEDKNESSMNQSLSSFSVGDFGRSVVVVHHRARGKKILLESLSAARAAGARVGLVILSDEAARVPTSVYARSDFVFRNYREKRATVPLRHFSPDSSGVLRLSIDADADSDKEMDVAEARDLAAGAKQARVFWMPLGYTALTNFWEKDFGASRLASARRYLWFFRGSPTSSSRLELLHVVTSDPFLSSKGLSGQTPSWGSGDGAEYSEIMLDTAFALCPQGWAAETFRMYEALVFGAIPVLQDAESDPRSSPYRVLGRHPLPVVKSWGEVPALLRRYHDRPDLMNKLQAEVVSWWRRITDHFAQQFAREVLGGFGRNEKLLSSQDKERELLD